jgi:CubicO group peptidase (beta-lactamase class C family)
MLVGEGLQPDADPTAVLLLAADGRLGLDDPAYDQLRAVRLADDAVTVRELLTCTGGVN